MSDPGGYMDSRKIVLKETAAVLIGQAVCVAMMFGVCGLLGRLDSAVLAGGFAGGLLATLNFFFMAIGASLAADKAEVQDVKGGKATLQTSMMLRYLILFVLLFALAKSGLCNVLALALPLAFVRPILTVGEFFRKTGDTSR